MTFVIDNGKNYVYRNKKLNDVHEEWMAWRYGERLEWLA